MPAVLAALPAALDEPKSETPTASLFALTAALAALDEATRAALLAALNEAMPGRAK
jgi:hypothetical protein